MASMLNSLQKICWLKKSKAIGGVCLLSCALLLNGCSTSENIHLERYTLTQDIDPATYNKLDFYDCSLQIAPILAQGGVVLQLDDVSLLPANTYRYTSDLDHELLLLLVDRMLKANFSDKYHYSVFVSKFQGSVQGQVLVQLHIQVKNNKGKVIFSQRYDRNDPLRQDGYTALVEQLKQTYLEEVDRFITSFQELKL